MKKCPFCGDHIFGDNRELLNDFGFDAPPVPFGCSHCITRPLSELNVPDGFIDFHKDARAAAAVDQYRRAIASAERLKGRL